MRKSGTPTTKVFPPQVICVGHIDTKVKIKAYDILAYLRLSSLPKLYAASTVSALKRAVVRKTANGVEMLKIREEKAKITLAPCGKIIAAGKYGSWVSGMHPFSNIS